MSTTRLKSLGELRKGERGLFHTKKFMESKKVGASNKARLVPYHFADPEMVQVAYIDSYYKEICLQQLGTGAQVTFTYGAYGVTQDEQCFEVVPITQEMVTAWIDQQVTTRRDDFVKALPHRPVMENGVGHSGSDPELFFVTSKGECLPAFQVLKKKPLRSSEDISLFWDGYQAEMTVPAATCHESLMYYINNGLYQMNNAVHMIDPAAQLSWAPEIHLPLEALANEEESFVQLGCDPSQNVYGTAGLQVDDPRQLPWRFAGCHMHFSTTKKDRDSVERTVKAMDAIGGVTLTAMLQGMETDVRRRYYGRAGEYRLPKHGIEYRTPSAAILAHPALTFFAFDLCRFAFGIGQRGMNRLWAATDEEVQEAINNVDVTLAKKLVRRNKDIIETWATKRYGATNVADKTMTLITKGVRNYMPGINIKTKVLDTSVWSAANITPMRYQNFLAYHMK